MTPVEDGKADFIQDRHDVYRDQWDRILQWGKQTGLNPACHMGEWTFMAQEQVRVSGWKMNNRKHGGGGGASGEADPTRFLLQAGQVVRGHLGEWGEGKEPDQVLNKQT